MYGGRGLLTSLTSRLGLDEAEPGRNTFKGELSKILDSKTTRFDLGCFGGMFTIHMLSILFPPIFSRFYWWRGECS